MMCRKLDKNQILAKISAHRGEIKRFGVKKIGLFGSFVSDEANEESDLDFLVKFEKTQKTFDNYMDLKFFLEDLFGYKVDLVIQETIKSDLKPHIMETVEYAAQL